MSAFALITVLLASSHSLGAIYKQITHDPVSPTCVTFKAATPVVLWEPYYCQSRHLKMAILPVYCKPYPPDMRTITSMAPTARLFCKTTDIDENLGQAADCLNDNDPDVAACLHEKWDADRRQSQAVEAANRRSSATAAR